MDLLEKLEEIKQVRNYAVNLTYGEDIGCDDLDVKPMERRVILFVTPIGCIGEGRMMWRGKVKDFLEFDFKKQIPTVIDNPPKSEQYEKNGYYLWGTPEGVNVILDKIKNRV